MPNSVYNNQRSVAHKATDLIYTCAACGAGNSVAQSSCGCGNSVFKVARQSPTLTPLTDDPDSQYDPYRTKQYSPERGQQFNNFGGEGTATQTIGGPNDRQPHSMFDSDPTARPLPSDGGDGDHFPDDANANGLLEEGSPLSKPTSLNDMNIYNFMRQTRQMKQEDPYEIIRKRKFR